MENTVRICPHCGSRAELVSVYDTETGSYSIFVKCQKCGAQGGAFSTAHSPHTLAYEATQRRALSAWNASIYERTGNRHM